MTYGISLEWEIKGATQKILSFDLSTLCKHFTYWARFHL